MKAKNTAFSHAAERQLVREFINVGQRGEHTNLEMQEVDQAAIQATNAAQIITERRSRIAFQREAQKQRLRIIDQRQMQNRFRSDSIHLSYPSFVIESASGAQTSVLQAQQSDARQTSVIRRILKDSASAPKTKPTAGIKTRSVKIPAIGQQAVVASSSQSHNAERTAQIKTAGSATQSKTRSSHKSSANTKNAAVERGRSRLRRDTQRKMAIQTRQPPKLGSDAAKETVSMMGKTARSVINAIVGSVGLAVVLLVFLLIAIIAAIVSSPFGVFFSEGGEDRVPLSVAIAEINAEYCDRLMELQTGGYDEINVEGNAPDWVDVVAIFACHMASGEGSALDVATLDRFRVVLLKEVFWSMCEISTEEHIVEFPDPTPDDDVDESYTVTSLIIHIHGRTAEEMQAELDFSDYQSSALDALLAERESLRILMGNLTVLDDAAAELWRALPSDLSDERRQVIRHALSLVGKVNYFWGGKSRVLGWDSRWGQLTRVAAEGSETTGSFRTFGLDCSGFVDWAFYNATNGEYVIGHGGGAASQRRYCAEITWEEAQPGDLVFYSDDSHVGIVGGRNENGSLRIIHCTSGVNNVTISDESGFSVVGMPEYYTG